MLTSSSPLLEGQRSTDPSSPYPSTAPLKRQHQQLERMWKRISIPSLIFNLTVLSALIYGAGYCIHAIQATLMPKNNYCLHSVSTSYNYFSFAGPGYGSWFGPKCLNPVRIASTYASGKTFCTDAEIEVGFEKIRTECEQLDLEFLDWRGVVRNITDPEIAGMRVVEFGEVWSKENITQPIRLSRPFFERVDNTLTTWEYEMNWHHRSGFALYGFWGLVLGIATLNHVFTSFDTSSAASSLPASGILGFFASSRQWIRTNLVIPPAFGSHHQRLLFWHTIPTRMESVIVVAFYLFTTYLSVAHYRVIENNIYWDDPKQQFWRYVADRTGIMAYATLPLIWVFAGRNSVFMWATGLTYQAFNIFHRHVARAGTMLAIVHSVVYTWLFVKYEGFASFAAEVKEIWLMLGIVATIAMSFLLVFSISWLRIKFYEAFLILHIALSIAVLVGCFLHTSIFNAQYDAYLWPLVVVWVLDRSLRLLRLILCNLRIGFSRSIIHRAKSTASYSTQSDVIRIDITTDSLLAKPAAGQFYYIYQPTTWQGYENHPFTLGAWTSTSVATDDADNPLLLRSDPYDDDDDTLDIRTLKPHTSSQGSTLTFWVRPYDGWTKRLRDQCLQSPTQTMHPLLLLEGPYGHHANLSAFETIILIAGGTGIASAVPYIYEHIRLSKSGASKAKNVHMVWTARQAAFITEVYGRELRTASQREDFEAELFCTRNAAMQRRKSGESIASTGTDIEGPDIQCGRPDIAAVIAKAAETATMDGIRVAVLVCGPPAMADEARLAVHRALKRGHYGLEYFEESFGW